MDEKEIDDEYDFEEETSDRDDGGVEVDSGGQADTSETEEANTSVEDSAVESQEAESNDVDFENNYNTPQDYSWIVSISDEDIDNSLNEKIEKSNVEPTNISREYDAAWNYADPFNPFREKETLQEQLSNEFGIDYDAFEEGLKESNERLKESIERLKNLPNIEKSEDRREELRNKGMSPQPSSIRGKLENLAKESPMYASSDLDKIFEANSEKMSQKALEWTKDLYTDEEWRERQKEHAEKEKWDNYRSDFLHRLDNLTRTKDPDEEGPAEYDFDRLHRVEDDWEPLKEEMKAHPDFEKEVYENYWNSLEKGIYDGYSKLEEAAKNSPMLAQAGTSTELRNPKKEEKYSEGFDPNDYQYAQNLMEETSDFNYEKNKAKRDLDRAQKDYESSDEDYQRELERYNKEAEQAKYLERMGIKVEDLGVKDPGTLEDYKEAQKEKLDKAKEVFDKFQSDSNVFTSYLDKYKGDWDKYQSTLTKEEVKENKNSLVDEAQEAVFKAERAATWYMSEKYGKDFLSHMPEGGWTVENCQEIIDNASSAAPTEVDEKLVGLAKDIIGANENFEKAKKEAALDTASRREESDEMRKAAIKEAYEKYQKGEISAVDFANKMNEAKKYGDLSFDVKPEERELERVTTPGSMEYSKIIQGLRETIQPKIENIDVQDITAKEQAKVATDSLIEVQAELIEQSHTVFVDVVKDLVAQGKELKDIRESEHIKEFSQEVFELSQSIYDKASALEEKAKALGLDEYADVSKWEKMKTTASAAWDAVIHGKSMNSNEAYAVMNTMQSIEGVKSASLALMKSAAFNGATDVKGGKASEAMKAEVVSKLSWKDFASTSLWGGLGILATGIGIVTGNPLLVAAGIYVNLKKGGEFAGKVTMSNVTKGEQMFGMKDSKIMNPAIQVYNQSQEVANIGDLKSASTYVTATQGTLEIISGLMLMIGTAGVGAGVGISNIKDGIDSLYRLNKGGLDGNTRTLISNIYVLGERVEAWSGMDIPELERLIQTLAETKPDEAGPSRVSAEYGTSSTDIMNADSKYSGYREQAKDSNLATDYNEGMEKETNEAVSDKYVKIFKTILTNEPEHIRKVLMGIKK